MKKLIVFILIYPLFDMKLNAQSEPKAPKHDTVLKIHKHERQDDYFWMNKRDSKEVLDYIFAENNYSETYFKKLEGLQSTLLKEFENRIDPNDVSAPYFIQGREFQSKNSADKDYQDIYEKMNGKEKLFFSENERSKGKSYYDLGDWAPSTNNQILAFSEDHIGRRKYTIYFRDEKSGKILKDQIKNTDGSLIWANDNKTVFYVKKDEQTLREFQVFAHILGTDSKSDKLVFEEKDERFSVHISKTLTDKYILINIESSTTSEVRVIDAEKPRENPIIFLERKSGILYSLENHGTQFYVVTNENAKNNKILVYNDFPTKDSSPKTFVSHDESRLIESLVVFKTHALIQSRFNGLQEFEIINLTSNKKEKIKMNEETYSIFLGLNDDFNANSFYYSYTSLTTPSRVYSYNFESGKSEIFFEKKQLDPNFKVENYESQRVWATANDGTLIPISLVYKKGTDLSKAPLLLYGYGSYGVIIPATFSPTRLSLLDRGFVYAIAHIRGGKDLGEDWYQNGKFQKKVNTFTDFINAAEYLAMKKYCDPSKIYAQGGSAGGLLMGAVANMAPYLWKGVVAQVPFVDVVSTMLDESIPLTVGEYEEWGNPNEEDYYYYMLNYSPYDNVKKMDYPAILITTGYHDSQVQYWEPLKWIAKLRDNRTNQNLLLLDCNMDAGHGGGSGRSNSRKETAKTYSFILDLEGIEK
ncbi:MAG: S9 family peptidase [Flavobacteriia bacterium]